MSMPTPPYAPVPPQYTPLAPRNGLGVAGFVLGLIGLIFSPIPLVGVIAWPLTVLGLVFSLIGYSRARHGQATNGGLALTGAILAGVGLLVCIIWVAAIGSFAHDVTSQADKTVTISYDAGGDAQGATVSYSTFSDNGTSDGQENVALPWHKQVQATGFTRGGVLIVTAGPDGGTVTCQVSVDGQVMKTAQASGPFASATCSNF